MAKLSARAMYYLNTSLEKYNTSTDKAKEHYKQIVTENLNRNEAGLNSIGYGLDVDLVAAGKAFLKRINKQHATKQS